MKYHSLFEQATDAIMVTDFNGNFKDVNSSFCTLFGYAKEELLRENIKTFLHPEHLKTKPIRFDLLASGITIFNEREMVHRNGKIIYVEANAKKISDDCILVIAHDITERKFLEKELLEQKVQEQKKITKAVIAAQEKERAEIGAELHDNVNQLLATAGLYLHHCIAQQGDSSEFIIKSHEYLLAAMEELRKLSHALVGPTQNEAMGLIMSLKKLISNISAVKDIQINLSHSSFVEDESEVGLKLVIYRIVQEQLNNILKHATASKVDIELKKEVNYLIVSIKDNGKGFDTSIQRNGIGLKNIKNRAEIYNGVVQIISSPGEGCKMKIIFILQPIEKVINSRDSNIDV